MIAPINEIDEIIEDIIPTDQVELDKYIDNRRIKTVESDSESKKLKYTNSRLGTEGNSRLNQSRSNKSGPDGCDISFDNLKFNNHIKTDPSDVDPSRKNDQQNNSLQNIVEFQSFKGSSANKTITIVENSANAEEETANIEFSNKRTQPPLEKEYTERLFKPSFYDLENFEQASKIFLHFEHMELALNQSNILRFDMHPSGLVGYGGKYLNIAKKLPMWKVKHVFQDVKEE